MTTLLTSSPPIRTLGDLLEWLGDIPPRRVRLHPPPGQAMVTDVVAIEAHENRLCEVIDGVLVEKAIGFRESLLAGAILAALRAFVVPRKLGLVSGADGMMQLFPGQVRIPDVAYVSRERLPGGRVPSEPVPHLVPDLVVEVLSEGNTEAEMERKRREYFEAGVRLIWLVDLDARTVTVFTGPAESSTLDQNQTLDGGAVLPGFTLPLPGLFAELDTCASPISL
ncbi:MAG: Uma2 family endonuclease, partial [Phycisphaerae bacterium]|nr:Uma2 family endonuclease [Phycisphaerae bacterium]